MSTRHWTVGSVLARSFQDGVFTSKRRKGKPVVRRCGVLAVLIVVVVAVTTGAPAPGITPEEVFQDGRRAFLRGHWSEAREWFDRFVLTWPEHALTTRAQLKAALSELRSRGKDRAKEDAAWLAGLACRAHALRGKVDAEEAAELLVAIEEPVLRERVASPALLADLSPQRLSHALARGFIPGPASDPIGTLSWIHSWLRASGRQASAVLRGRLELWRAKALWACFLSPLAAQAHAERLAEWGDWPLEPALHRAIQAAFRDGNADVRREAALLGVSVHRLAPLPDGRDRPREGPPPYLAYLRDRGLYAKEAWCPR